MLGQREGALAAIEEAVRAIREPFLAHPMVHRNYMGLMLTEYLRQWQAIGREEPDPTLLMPILEAFQNLQEKEPSENIGENDGQSRIFVNYSCHRGGHSAGKSLVDLVKGHRISLQLLLPDALQGHHQFKDGTVYNPPRPTARGLNYLKGSCDQGSRTPSHISKIVPPTVHSSPPRATTGCRVRGRRSGAGRRGLISTEGSQHAIQSL